MKLLATFRKQPNLILTENDLSILSSALNEICNGISVSEFDTRIGASRDDVVMLLVKINYALDAFAVSK